jgi:hypothetical protein
VKVDEYPSSHYTDESIEDSTENTKKITDLTGGSSQKSTNSTNTGTGGFSPPKFKRPKAFQTSIREVESATFACVLAEAKLVQSRLHDLKAKASSKSSLTPAIFTSLQETSVLSTFYHF